MQPGKYLLLCMLFLEKTGRMGFRRPAGSLGVDRLAPLYPQAPGRPGRHGPIDNAAGPPGMTQPWVAGAGAWVNAPAGPGNTTGLSNPSAETADTPKNQSSMLTSWSR